MAMSANFMDKAVKMKYITKGTESPNLCCTDRKEYETKEADAYEQTALSPNALPLILLGKSSDTNNHTKGPKLIEYPAATPSTANVANTFMTVGSSSCSLCSAYEKVNIRRDVAIIFMPSNTKYLLPNDSTFTIAKQTVKNLILL